MTIYTILWVRIHQIYLTFKNLLTLRIFKLRTNSISNRPYLRKFLILKSTRKTYLSSVMLSRSAQAVAISYISSVHLLLHITTIPSSLLPITKIQWLPASTLSEHVNSRFVMKMTLGSVT